MRTIFLILIASIALHAQDFIPFRGGGSPATGNGLLNNLTAFWPFEETSGDAADSSGNGRTLTDHGPMAVAEDGQNVVGNARVGSPADNTDYLSRDSEPALTFGTNAFTIAGWLILSQLPLEVNDPTLIAKTDFSSLTNTSWWVQFDHGATDRFRFFYSDDGDWGDVLDFPLDGTVEVSRWYFICVRWNGSTIHLSVTSAEDSSVASDVTVAFAGPFFDNPSVPVTVGTVTGSDIYDLNGRIDELGIWSAYLSDCQVTHLFSAKGGTFTYGNFDALTCAP